MTWPVTCGWFLAVLMLHGVLMSYSRGAMVGIAIAGPWILLNHRPRRHSIVIGAVACLAISTLAGTEIRERFISTGDYEQDVSANSRFESWAAGWKIALEYPGLRHE